MAYQKINFKNLPSKTTPINAQNLNKMDNQIYLNANNIDMMGEAYERNYKELSDRIGVVEQVASDTSATLDFSNIPYMKIGLTFGDHTYFAGKYPGIPNIDFISNYIYIYAMNPETNTPRAILAVPVDYASNMYVYQEEKHAWSTFAPIPPA